MKRIFFLSLLTLLISTHLNSQDDGGAKSTFRTIHQNAFSTGEKLTFDVIYGFITAGTAVMEVAPDLVTINGRKAYEISVVVNSTSTFDWVYRVRDRYLTIMDKEGLFPWRFEQHIREGNYARDFEAIFDQQNGIAKAYTGEFEPKNFEGEYSIPEYVQDAVSAFYFSRTFDFTGMNVGDKKMLQNFYKDTTYPLEILYLGKETVKVKAGEFRCIKVQPFVQEGGLFKSDGDLFVWLTDDERKLPVKVKTKVVVGSMDVELTAYSGLSGPVNARIR